jgi:uncharacterized repeat protein (TIGR03803 family)
VTWTTVFDSDRTAVAPQSSGPARRNGWTIAAIMFLVFSGTIAPSAQTVTLTTLVTIDAPFASPSGLVQGTDGNLYGTEERGGSNSVGAVFMITPQGLLTTLYNFCSLPGCTDGDYPRAPLTLATDGNFYGTTYYGGASTLPYGTVFKLTTQGTLTTIYSFCSQSSCTDGSFPSAGLVQGADGNFYGTTYEGGANNFGTLFKITPKGQLTSCIAFAPSPDAPTANTLLMLG